YKEKGRLYRRADVVLYVPLEVNTLRRREGVRIKTETKGKETKVHVRTQESIEGDWLLLVPSRFANLEESALVEVYMGREPTVKKVLTVYPVEVTRDYVKFALPPLRTGEEMIIVLKHEGKIGKPQALISENKPKRRTVEVRITYSFTFPHAGTLLRDPNVKNVRELIKTLSELGKLRKVEIIGSADGNTKDPKRNEEVAKKRALTLARLILPPDALACALSPRADARERPRTSGKTSARESLSP
ncbi:MAG: hypothetical protein GXO04_00710, partial [Aquificae bacterium]|nr:hypothetical protein [Aquificota bacterium]